LPEALIESDPGRYVRSVMGARYAGLQAFAPEALAEYERCAALPGTAQSIAEDYRASAGIDLEHDRESRARGDKIACDTLVLWGERGVVNRLFKPLELWQAQCTGSVSGQAVPAGHFIPEELPELTAEALTGFMR